MAYIAALPLRRPRRCKLCTRRLVRWHRQRPAPIEHAHDVLINELAGATLPSQKFGANAARLRLNVILYNLLLAYKRIGLSEELHTASSGCVFCCSTPSAKSSTTPARSCCAKEIARTLADPPRTRFALSCPALAGV
jgi:hypothetical protein